MMSFVILRFQVVTSSSGLPSMPIVLERSNTYFLEIACNEGSAYKLCQVF